MASRAIKTFSLFYYLTQELFKNYQQASEQLLDYIFGTAIVTESMLDLTMTRTLIPLWRQYFNECAQAGNQLVQQEIAVLTNALKVPFKYNLSVINQINDISVFTGYYNDRYADTFSRQEIDRLKRTILKGTYEEVGEDELSRRIRKTVNVSDRRARLLARNETQRLRETTKTIYYREPEVQRNYLRVWQTRGDGNVRPSHQAMNNVTAQADGTFYSPDVGKVNGPGSGPTEFAVACRCSTIFVKR